MNTLDMLSKNNLHLHEIDEEILIPIYMLSYATHFIMQGAEVKWCGRLDGLEIWLRSFDNNEQKNQKNDD